MRRATSASGRAIAAPMSTEISVIRRCVTVAAVRSPARVRTYSGHTHALRRRQSSATVGAWPSISALPISPGITEPNLQPTP